MAMIEQYL